MPGRLPLGKEIYPNIVWTQTTFLALAEKAVAAAEGGLATTSEPLPLNGAPASRERQIRPEHDDRADDRRDPSARREAPRAVRLRVAAEERVPDQPADQRADHAEDGRGEPAQVLPAGVDGAGQKADDQTEDDEA